MSTFSKNIDIKAKRVDAIDIYSLQNTALANRVESGMESDIHAGQRVDERAKAGLFSINSWLVFQMPSMPYQM